MAFFPAYLSSLVLIFTALAGAFIAALWLAFIFWTYRDIRARSRDPLANVLATLLVTVLFLPGIVIYLILRPPQTLEQEYQKSLEEEAFLHAIEESLICPGCGRRLNDEWIICPGCHTTLKKSCHVCGKLMDLAWNICPNCAALVAGIRREGLNVDETLSALEHPDISGENPSTFEETKLT